MAKKTPKDNPNGTTDGTTEIAKSSRITDRELGWVSLHRKLAKNSLWLSEKFTYGQAWVDLLLLANHSSQVITKRGIKLVVPRGYVGWSQEKLGKRWRWSRGKVLRFFKYAVQQKMVEVVQQKNKLTTLIHIINYDPYQKTVQQKIQKTNIKRYRNNNVNKENIHVQFTKFYKAYPKKQGKQDALKAWTKRPELSNSLFETVMAALQKQKEAPPWKEWIAKNDKRYIPYPAKWLNGARWEDEVEAPVNKGWGD